MICTKIQILKLMKIGLKKLEKVHKIQEESFFQQPVAGVSQSDDANTVIKEVETSSSDTVQDTVVTDGYDSDHFSEVDAYEHAANIDKIIDDANIETKSNNILTFVPGEGRHPLSLYQDTGAEYLCFLQYFVVRYDLKIRKD